MFSLIAAVGRNRELGLKGGLVFHLKEDMQFFKETTMGHSVLMGLNTYRSLPKALPGRKNFVLAHDASDVDDPNVTVVTDLDSFISNNLNTDEEIFVIGGAFVYHEMLPYCQNLYLTEIDATAEADVFFPEFDTTKYNKMVLEKGQSDDLSYTFAKYIKK